MTFDPKVYRNNKDGIGGPGDAIATTTTEESTLVSLTKGIFGKLGGGTAATIASDVAQGSTTSGQTGGLVQGAVTTAAPTYVTAKTNPLSLETDGDLRTHDTAATTLLTSMNATLNTLNLSTDGLEAALGIITETAPASDTASSGLNGRLQRIAQRLTSLIAQVPATLGVKARTASLSVALATEDAALFPASLGAKAAASSFAVTQSTEDAAQLGSLTETAPASDTASSGLNGRLQRIAQRITSLIALVPASLGQKAMTASFAVTLASDDPLTVLQAASSASITALASSASSAQLLAANAARKGLILNNTDANAVLVKYGTTASASSFTVRITLNGYWEMPKPIYTGRIDAIWEADGSGSLYATEL
jgi:hypothetical protein